MLKDEKPYDILVIEDNPGDFIIVEDFLKDQILNVQITHASKFRQALDFLSVNDPAYDAILLDLTLPDKRGQPLIEAILNLATSCPVIILTGQTDIEFSIRSISQGVTDYLIKDDLNATTLYKSIVYAIERKKTFFQLQESEKRYSDIFYFSPQPTWIYESESLRFSKVNNAAIQLYGYTEGEFMKMTIFDLITDDIKVESDKLKGHGIKLSSSGTKNPDILIKGNFRHKTKTNKIIDVEIDNTPIIINKKSYSLVIAIDVTEKNLVAHKITKAIIKTQEDERYEIGAELHDNVCQVLATGKMNLGMLRGHVALEKIQWLDRCDENIRMGLDEIRNLSHRLAPAFFDNKTLEESFDRLLSAFNVQNKYKISFHFKPLATDLTIDPEMQLNLYRILQEQLRNIDKYANALIIDVVFFIYNNTIKMCISDDGVGFDVDNVKEGIGLSNIKRRAALFSGHTIIESSPGNGCTMIIAIPLGNG